ncbi:MAG: hypothetical protein QOH51_2018, partial [Acidobacteriota bacterium]|nr:hypothetical protein [Acidobacteriota bacterium]
HRRGAEDAETRRELNYSLRPLSVLSASAVNYVHITIK